MMIECRTMAKRNRSKSLHARLQPLESEDEDLFDEERRHAPSQSQHIQSKRQSEGMHIYI